MGRHRAGAGSFPTVEAWAGPVPSGGRRLGWIVDQGVGRDGLPAPLSGDDDTFDVIDDAIAELGGRRRCGWVMRG